jgi:hypothetical protein
MGTVQSRMVVAFETFGTSNVNLGLTASGQIAPVPTSGDTAGEGCPRLPLMSRRAMSKIVTNKGLLEQVNIQTGTVTAANNFDYSFKVRQVVNGLVRIVNFFYTSDATGSQAEVVTAVINTFNAQNAQGGIFVTATGSTSITLTGQAGYPLFDVFDVSGNLSFASGMASQSVDATGVANVDAAPIKVKIVGHGYLTGQTVNFDNLDVTVNSALIEGRSLRVTRVDADTFTVAVPASGTSVIKGGTTTLVAQEAYGTSTQVDADFASNGQSYTATATALYDSYDIVVEGETNVFTGRIWCNAVTKASPSTATANYSAFSGDIIAFTGATTVGTTITIAKMLGLPTV